MPPVTYEGPTQRDDITTEFHVRDSDGEMHKLVEGRPYVDAPDDLVAELLEGSDRTKGHKFREATEDEVAAAGLKMPTALRGKALDAALDAAGLPKGGTVREKQARLAEHQAVGDDGGPAGSGTTGGSAAGTTTAAART